MNNDLKNFLEETKEQVEREWNMGGLSDGLYGDYVTEVCERYKKQVQLKYHNEVLDLVENEIDNKRALDSEIFAASGNNDEESRDRIKVLEDISTIINKLRV